MRPSRRKWGNRPQRRAVNPGARRLTGNATASPVHAITRLREVVARLAELEDGGGEAGRWFVNVMIEYQSGAHLRLRLDEAAGLIPKPGHNWWWEAEKLQRRDEYL